MHNGTHAMQSDSSLQHLARSQETVIHTYSATTTALLTPNVFINTRCFQIQTSCMFGTQALNGQCCAEKTNNVCFATLEASCPGDCLGLGSICAPSKPYMDVFSKVSVEAVANPSPKVRVG